MAVAIAYDWLYHDLQESTKVKVRKAIVEKAFEASYIKENAWFLEAHNNWNSVCNAGLVFGALAILEDEQEQSIAVIERALQSNLLPLQTYCPDGNYPEGPGYWNYGTTFQVMLFAALESALGSDNGLSKASGFLESSYYMLFTTGPSGYYFNYSDCGRQVRASSSMFWFAEFELTKIAFGFLDATESCTIVDRQESEKMMVYHGNDKKSTQEVKITENHKRRFVDVSTLGISLQGGENYTEFLSLFNTNGGSRRLQDLNLL